MARKNQDDRRGGLPRPLAALIVIAVAAVVSAALVPGVANAASAPSALQGTGSGRCVNGDASGSQLTITDCGSAAGQQFTLTADGQLQTLGKCLDASGWGKKNGTKLILWDCTGGANQQWTLADGTLTGANSGLCVDVNGAHTTSGSLVQLWACNGGTNQKWSLPTADTDVSGTTPTTDPATSNPATTDPASIDPATSDPVSSTPPVIPGTVDPTQPPATVPVVAATSSGPGVATSAPASDGAAPTHFSTLAVGATLPTGAQCASWVRAIPTGEKRADNAVQNATLGRALTASAAPLNRVDGQFTGTTEQILRWAACKWGIDEDIVKAQAVKESWWHMSTLGDFGTDASRCATGHTLGSDGQAGKCPESIGILQVRYPYHSVSFPQAQTSTAMNADYAYEQWYACYTGKDTWLTNGYAAGDAWGCVGAWFSGNFHDSGADNYIGLVQTIVTERTWAGSNF